MKTDKKVFILRGVPGSGKSTYIAKKVKEIDEKFPVDVEVVSADHYFEECPHESDFAVEDFYQYHKKGCTAEKVYKFDATRLGRAHRQCQDRFIELLSSNGAMFIFVDNTNTTIKELNSYVKACVGHDVEFVIVNIVCDPKVAATRNKHGVPVEKVLQMHERMTSAKIPDEWNQEIYRSDI